MRDICAGVSRISPMLDVRPLRLEGVFEIRPARIEDSRGFFSEVWSYESLAVAGFEIPFVQDNHSLSAAKGVLRGLHFQVPPAAQHKLVRVSRGSVFDVAVDIRRESATFGQWVGAVLSAEFWNQLLIPPGFAHGFLALEEQTEVQYKVSGPYRSEFDRAIRFDDPAIGIDWPIAKDQIQLSDKDRNAPLLSDVETGF
jgi:dTDP-4-dehydrorhamnose 3,5-epimerase